MVIERKEKVLSMYGWGFDDIYFMIEEIFSLDDGNIFRLEFFMSCVKRFAIKILVCSRGALAE